MAFKCQHCQFDLSVRMDLLALAIKADYPDGDYPKELALDGTCDSCGGSFNYSGEFFSHYMNTKVEEGVIGPKTGKYAIMAFDVSEEEHEEFKRRIHEFIFKFSNNNEVLANEILNYLRSWLINHIIGVDKKYSLYLNERGIT